ncbi:hypothetical protein AX774_g2741 [Zancudomyces culisetae]|uniref:Uncharacterized protein n=1 Tax=Zancudomyces culisetae TaxID=1213189 RepID=A0A1R1PRY8_ZANCU|nr:hypothetical protein AX774_g2741 [Zancudomyces culisetae]|eukprot:OMH83727.1 hypothetical protein AX774_g2741 [Zancudomyces culisetae]
MIDHIFYSGLQAKWSMKQIKAEKKSKMNTKAIKESSEEFKTNNWFSALMALDDTEIMAKELEVAVKESAE